MTKSLTHLIVAKRPLPCHECRHANQATVDFAEGLMLCGIDGAQKRERQRCDATVMVPLEDERFARRYYGERFDGDNGTFGRLEDRSVIAEDAPPETFKAWQRS